MTLQEFVTDCSEAAAQVFHLRGHISPMWHAFPRVGTPMVLPSPCEDKDMAVAIMRMLFEQRDVVRYAFVDEAWQVELAAISGESAADLERRVATQPRPAQHPQRIEIVMISAEDEHAGALMGQRKIIRPAHGKPRLGPLEICTPGKCEGRMIGLLPQRGALQ